MLSYQNTTRMTTRHAGFSSSVRLALAACALVVLAACEVPNIRATGDTGALNVVAVNVETSGMATAVQGRASSVTLEQLDADLTAAITAALASQSDPEGRDVTVNVTMETFRLAPPIERVAAGTSSATGVISVTEVGTGTSIVPPTRLTGNTENIRAAWILGLATTRTVDIDYRGTVNGFADTTRKALFAPEN